MQKTHLRKLVQSCESGQSLPQPFYTDEQIFNVDSEHILKDMWHIAGHISQIPSPGDYFLYRLCGEEIIIVRDKKQELRAHFNVCRHRGSRICSDDNGNKSVLTCPYHAWAYNLDGTLRGARLMPDDFDKSIYSLHTCAVRVLHGIIFVSLSDNPDDLDAQTKPFAEYLTFHGIEDAQIARRTPMPTAANWKLVVENFIECYHCQSAHPEYCAVHSKLKLLAAGAGTGSGPEKATEEYEPILEAWLDKVKSLGHPYQEGVFGAGIGMSRMPIAENALTESRDGQPVAPLMGKASTYDGGVSYIAFNYLNYLIASNDHALLLSFIPSDCNRTNVEASWLVNSQATSGVDYNPEDVSWVWDVTLKQDVTITENNQSGVSSSKYQPGPYSTQENMNIEFVDWYLGQIPVE